MKRGFLRRTPGIISGWPTADVWAWSVVALIGLHTVVFGAMQVLSGDDAGYASTLSFYEGKPLGFLRSMAHHYLWVNGRMANLLAPLWLSEVPRLILDVANGVACFGFYAMTLVICGLGKRHTATAKLAVTALLLFTFPWWDSFMLFDVMFNYVWSAALVLVVLYLLQRGVVRRWLWCAWLLAAFAASMHEGLSMPVSAGIAVWLWLSGAWRGLSSVQRGMIAAFWVGTLFVMLSPGIWGRFFSEAWGVGSRQPDDVIWLLLLKSDFYVLLFIAFVVVLAIWRRRQLMEMAQTPWVIFAIASLVGLCLSGVSGIVGRSGWFASLMAVIAMVKWCGECGWHIGRTTGAVVSGVFSVAIIVHIVSVDVVQSRMHKELVTALGRYSRNPDEPVYMDYTPWDAWQWLTLAKVRGVPEAYEESVLRHYALLYVPDHASVYHPEDAPLMIVLPEEAENVETGEGMVRVGDGFLTATLPELPYEGATTYVIGGREYYPVCYTDKQKRRMYYLALLRLRCGDRKHYLPAIDVEK